MDASNEINLPNEILLEIISHMPVIDIVRVEKALTVDIPDYIYLNIHRRKFARSIEEIQYIKHMVTQESDASAVLSSSRKIVRDNEIVWKCVYTYHNKTPSNNINKFKTGRSFCNILSVASPKFSNSFTQHISSSRMELFTIKESLEFSPNMFILNKGNKTAFGLNPSAITDSAYVVIFIENNIY